MKINLHIERVSFEDVGLHRRDAARLQRILETEIARQLQHKGALLNGLVGGAVAEMPAVDLRIDGATTPEQWGRGIASSIVGGFRQ